MRFTLPSPPPTLTPGPPRPRRPAPHAEPEEPPQAAGLRSWIGVLTAWNLGRLRRYRAVIGTAVGSVIAVLLCFGIGWAKDDDRHAEQARTGRGSAAIGVGKKTADKATTGPSTAAQARKDKVAAQRAAPTGAAADNAIVGDKAAAERAAAAKTAADAAAARRAADDKAAADKLTAAKAADAKAAAERAARAKAAAAGQARTVTMPALVGRKLHDAMTLAAKTGLTAVTVCHTPDGDTPIWWPNWQIVAQDVPAGTRVSAGRAICVDAAKR
jgi:hypothetical protein